MKSVRTRLILGTIAAILLISLLVFYMIDQSLESYIMENVQENMTGRSYEIQQHLHNMSRQYGREFLKGDGLNYLEHSLETRYEDMQIWLYSGQQAEAEELPFHVENSYESHRDLLLRSRALAADREGNMIRIEKEGFSHSHLVMHFPFYDSLEPDSEPVGVVGMEYLLSDEQQLLERFRFILLVALGGFIFSTGTFLYFYISQITSPLSRLKEAIERFQRGDSVQYIEVNTDDEIGELAQAFNEMRTGIDSLIEDLKKEKSRQKDFYENMTHELKTPLTIIKGFGDMYHRVEDEEKKEKCLDHMIRETERMLDMVNNLLKNSRSGNYSLDIDPRPIRIDELCQRTIDLIEVKALSRSITIDCNIERDVWSCADPLRIKEVLLNLLDNAISYSGTDLIEVGLESRDEYLEILIIDSGCGISCDRLERFEQGKMKEGQGLNIARRIVESHDGYLEIESHPGRGTKARILLPRGEKEE